MKTLSDCVVLVVDDTPTNIDVLVETLGDTYEVMVAIDGPSALEILQDTLPDLILLDVMMPGMSGFDVLERLRADVRTSSIPVILVTALSDIESKIKGFSFGAVDYLIKPFEIEEVKLRVKNHLTLALTQKELKELNATLEEKVRERTLHIKLTQETTIEALSSLAEYRDPETGAHIIRTKHYIKAMVEAFRSRKKYLDILTDNYVEHLILSAPLHDIGKVAIPDTILNKPDRLTPEEFEEMKRHTVAGYQLFKKAEKRLGHKSFLNIAAELAYTHHEKWNGTGYPRGLKAEEIPFSGRLMALADVYDALLNKRVYKPPFSHDKAIAIIKEERGQHFDPFLTDIFLELQDGMRRIAIQYMDEDMDLDGLSCKL